MGMRGQRHASAALLPAESHGTHFRGGFVDSRAGKEGYGEQKVSYCYWALNF
jgi:hypothetical protein